MFGPLVLPSRSVDPATVASHKNVSSIGASLDAIIWLNNRPSVGKAKNEFMENTRKGAIVQPRG